MVKKPTRSEPAFPRWHRFLPFGVIAGGVLAYHNSFLGPFLLDDRRFIADNFYIRHPWPFWDFLTSTIRPVTDLSFALNFAMGGLQVWGYHALNLAIHLLAGLTLFGIIRRTLRGKLLQARYGVSAPWIALAVATLWTVHPLQTQSVTYIIQRAESLMGLFYLLTLYSFIRSVASEKQIFWSILAVVACALGTACKPIIVTAPLLVWVYDRVFVAGSFSGALRQRKGLYLGLAATWALLILLLNSQPLEGAGLGLLEKLTPMQYALTQPKVILLYLKLAVWPHPLCFDYNWPPAASLDAILLPSFIVGGALIATGWTFRRLPALGFLGIWFFLILAPSSSFIPIADLLFEHRMYLPLAAVVTLAVLAADRLLHQRFSSDLARRRVGATSLILLITVLAGVTIQRNRDYRSELSIWADTVAKQPNNPRSRNVLGAILAQQGRYQEAMVQFQEALRLNPQYAEIYLNLGNTFNVQGKREEAIRYYAKAIELDPRDPDARYNMGLALSRLGKQEEALLHYRKVLEINPLYAQAYHNIGAILTRQGKLEEAIRSYARAVQIRPDYPQAFLNLGLALAKQNKFNEAALQFQQALRLKPDYADAHYNLAVVLTKLGKQAQALKHFQASGRSPGKP